MSEVIEATIIIIEWEETPAPGEHSHEPGHEHHRHIVHIYNELDGHTYRIHARDGTHISKVIDQFLHKIHRERQPGDRLVCDSDCEHSEGEDVFQFAALTVGQYLLEGHCPKLNWTFIGDTGGA